MNVCIVKNYNNQLLFVSGCNCDKFDFKCFKIQEKLVYI